MARAQVKRIASSVAALLCIAACALLVSQQGESRPFGDAEMEEMSRSDSMSLRRLEHENEHLTDEVGALKTDFQDEEKENDRLQSEVSALSSKVSGLVLRRGPAGPKGQTGDRAKWARAATLDPLDVSASLLHPPALCSHPL